MNQGLLYFRVSSNAQEDGFSLDAQEKLGHEYARRNTIEVVRTWKISESAWRKDRVGFEQLVEYARKHPEIEHIIFDVPDRMTRNDFDKLKIYNLVEEYGKTIHFARSNRKWNKHSAIDDEFFLDIEVAAAKRQSNDISRKTRMGMQEKAEQGMYPSTAPLGYTNNPITKMIDVDAERAPLIKRMFDLMATGNYSCEMLSQTLYREGLRNKRGTRSHKSAIAHHLRNPIYYGAYKWKGRLYPQGKHTPLITKSLFDQVQNVLSGKSKVHIQQKGFAFNNLILCGNCGCKVLGELKKKQYRYYHCSFSKGRHDGKGYFREESIADLIGTHVQQVTLDRPTVDWLKTELREESRSSMDIQEQRLASLKTEYQKVNNRMSKLLDAKFDNEITEQSFIVKEREYQGQLLEIKTQIDGLKKTNPNFYDNACRTLELCNSLYPTYVTAIAEEKAQIANLVASNFTLDDVNLVPKWRKPFDIIVKGLSRSEWLPRLGSNQGHGD